MQIPPAREPGPILGLYPMRDAGAYYRVAVPLSSVPGATWACLDSNAPDGVTKAQLQAAETIIFYRCGGPVRSVRAMFGDARTRWGVTRILVDYDDAAFAFIPVKEVRPAPSALKGLAYALAHADGVLVQNQALVEHYRPYTDAPFAVVPNLVRVEDWPELAPPQDWPPVVVLAGSPSHAADWLTVLPALRWLREQAPDVRLRVIGCPLPEIQALATEWHPWVDAELYPDLLKGASIALCPLPATEFNVGKSPVKAYEYALASGAAVIGSPCQYAEVLAGGRGLIVPDGDAAGWAKCLAAYLTDPELRLVHARALRRWVVATKDVRRHAGRLTHIYDGGTYGALEGNGRQSEGGADERPDDRGLHRHGHHHHHARDDAARAVHRQ